MSQIQYYSLKPIMKAHPDAQYYMVFGERSNGKTTAGLEHILSNYLDNGEQGAIIRRFDEDLRGANGDAVWSSIVSRGLVSDWTAGRYDGITYSARKWYLTKFDEKLNKHVKAHEPFCFAFCLSIAERYKSTSYPSITTIMFDEFISARAPYLNNEFVTFVNLVSTIVRERAKAKIFMFANTVNKYCPYFKEMGLTNIERMQMGDIDVYRYGKSKLRVAVEYCGTALQNKDGKPSDVYFGFDNPKLRMITSGEWELPVYPHAPFKISQSSVLDHCYVIFGVEKDPEGESDDNYRPRVFQGDIILQDDQLFIYFHNKTTDIKEKDQDRQTYTLEFSPKINYAICPVKNPRNKLAARIAELFRTDRVFYQDNEVGDAIRNYVQESLRTNVFSL